MEGKMSAMTLVKNGLADDIDDGAHDKKHTGRPSVTARSAIQI